MQDIPPALLTTLQEVLAGLFWTKRPLRTFLEASIDAPDILDTISWNDTKRNIVHKVVTDLTRTGPRHHANLCKLIDDTCQMDDYSDLMRDDPTGGAKKKAQEAQGRFQDRVAKWKESASKPTLQVIPALSTGDYDAILEHLRGVSKGIERAPETFKGFGEEDFRNFLLASLNGSFKGQATGETFNYSGKTDILIRQHDRNMFVGECKIWSGAASFNKAITQLLNYLTWRDCKCALLIFNRLKGTKQIEKDMHEAVTKRPEFVATLPSQVSDARRYIIRKPDEPGQDIYLSSMVFDVPGK